MQINVYLFFSKDKNHNYKFIKILFGTKANVYETNFFRMTVDKLILIVYHNFKRKIHVDICNP